MRTAAFQNKDIDERLHSSSGGVFPLLAKEILKDGGVVLGAAFDKNFNVVHIEVDHVEDLPLLYGSKYAFSDVRDTFVRCKSYLEAGREVLFSGVPCQIAALRGYLKQDYESLFVLDCVCHGTPSNKTWQEYLDQVSSGRKPVSVSFRDKKKGWLGYNFRIVFEDGSEYCVNHNEDPYMQGFIHNLTLRQVCYHCPFKGTDNRKSDITLGDLWGAEHLAPQLFDDKGTSLLMIHTAKGEKLLARAADQLESAEIDFEKAVEINPAIVKPSKPNPNLDKFKEFYEKSGDLIGGIKKYAQPSAVEKVKNKIRKLFGF